MYSSVFPGVLCTIRVWWGSGLETKSVNISWTLQAINSLVALHKVMPEALQESTVYRSVPPSTTGLILLT